MRWTTLAPGLVSLAGFGFFALGASRLQTPREVPKKPTYAEHVAPILNRNCVLCHRPGEVGPFSLVRYEDARKWGPMIQQVTETGLMPPWKADDSFSALKESRRMAPEELATIAAWVKAGMPRGDRRKEPKPPVFATGWALGQPDLVLKPDRPYVQGPEGEDVYRYFVYKNESKEVRWVRAVDVHPDNRRILHHVIAFTDRTGRALESLAKNTDGQPGYAFDGGPNFIPDAVLGGWAPGQQPMQTPEGTAMALNPGAAIVLQVHYTRTGKTEKDATEFGLYFASEPPKQRYHIAFLDDLRLDIPAGEANYLKKSSFRMPRAVTVHSVMPHMHLLGQSMVAVAVLPDGTRTPLIRVPKWDFNWQMTYWLKEPIRLPAGTRVEVEARYDNSAENPRNPHSPPARIRWGEATKDEMSLLVLGGTFD